ncbi:hypothetical protein CORC01_02426 [Colletotrichum orchidophilum]|uniref:NAD(P)-binding domain-containing protein n=1 Tax=Colletotrichum orchidophilum TaxID=1209926 RepID=A0A1G4BLG2_9PEZI|nr:uncharacterized protein CORC01_02426 [Colletotrichum orchidophilum]OHF02146.1 hypothetical protein CORC01_02426 [Colletotrichum orchidophilum]
MSSFKNIALLGKGLLGTALVSELSKAGFIVTVFGRSESAKEGLPAGIDFKTIDYSSTDTVATAVQGQDVIVSTVSKGGLFTQKTVIDGAIKAGVKRYIPSDWGSFTTDPKAQIELAGLMKPMTDTQKYLKDKVGGIEHTIFSVGAFTDLVISSPIIFDYAKKTAQVTDAGHVRFASTSLAGIGKAVAGALKNPEATKNRNLKIQEFEVTQAQLLALAKKYSPPGTKWEETALDGQVELDRALKAVQDDPTNEYNMFGLIKAALLSGRYKASYEKLDNELVGLPLLTEKDLDAKFAAVFKS